MSVNIGDVVLGLLSIERSISLQLVVHSEVVAYVGIVLSPLPL